MSATTLVIFALAGGLLFMLGQRRGIFPYLLVTVLGLEYFSPGSADSFYTIPKMGFLALVASQVGSSRVFRLFTTRGLTFPLVAFIGYMAMTFLWSVDPSRTIIRGTSLVFLFALAVVVQGFIRSTADLQAFWRALLLYGLANAGFTAYQVATGSTTYVEETILRAGGLGVNPSEGAFYTAIGLFVLVAHIGRGIRVAPWMRAALPQVLALGVFVLGALATGARGGFAAIAITMLALVQFSGNTLRQRLEAGWRYLLLALIAAGLAAALPSVTEMAMARLAQAGIDQLGNRVNIWGEMWVSIVQRPWAGNGLNSTAIATGRYALTYTYSSHNTPLGVLLDGGLIGVALFAVLAWRLAKLLRRLRRSGIPELEFHGMVLVVLVTLAAGVMMSYDLMYNKIFWMLLGLSEGAHFLLVSPARARGRPAHWRRSDVAPAEAVR